MPFLVDAFGPGSAHIDCRSFFCTHFHSDHYGGLGPKWDRGPRCSIYCSRITRNLLERRLRVQGHLLQELEVGVPREVEGVLVTALEANHCPGAVMLLFEPRDRQPVLHTGDFRFTRAMMIDPRWARLQSMVGRCRLILDTTYCSPEYTFPLQQDLLGRVVEAVRAEAFNVDGSWNHGTLFLFGTYTLGKEAVFLEVARALRKPVYVGLAKKEVLDCLELPEQDRRLLTTDDQATNLHVVPLMSINRQRIAALLQHYKGRFNCAIGFKLTGWSQAGMQRAGPATVLKRTQCRDKTSGTIVLYEVPYSEHSSFEELREFVRWFRPLHITPSVGNDGGPKLQEMLLRLKS